MKFIRGTLPGLEGQHDIAVLEGDTHICKWIAEHGRLDQDANMWPRMEQLGLINRESVVYDLGAYVGDCTAWYAARANAVVAFEAYGDACECLDHNMAPYIERGNSQVFIVRRPVGNDEPTMADEYKNYPSMPEKREEENKASRSIVMCDRWIPGEPVYTLRIDDLLKWKPEIPPPTFIKLDIEGWEVRALLGAAETIRAHRPVILCEANRAALERAGSSLQELHGLMVGFGYHMVDFYTGETWRPNNDVACCDFLATPWKL